MNKNARCTASVPARKMKVELFDNEGNRYSVSFEGQITREKATRLLDLMELLGGMSPSAGGSNSTTAGETKYERLRATVRRSFPLVWFSSREVQSLFEQEFKEPISLSTAATYLARMATRGVLLRTGPSNRLRYKVAPNAPEAAVKQHMG